MNHRSTVITIGKRRPVMTPSIHRELVCTYWNHRQLVKRYQAGRLSAVMLLLRDLLGIAHNVTYINQH